MRRTGASPGASSHTPVGHSYCCIGGSDLHARRIITRQLPVLVGTTPQTLVVAPDAIHEVHCNVDGRVQIRKKLELEVLDTNYNERFHEGSFLDPFCDGIFDHYSASCILTGQKAVYLLTLDNCVKCIAGEAMVVVSLHPEQDPLVDGTGKVARFRAALYVTSDVAGGIYVSDLRRIRKVQLPPALHGQWLRRDAAGLAAASESIAVTTLPFEAEADITGLTFAPGGGEGAGYLVYSTSIGLHRVALSAPGSSGPASSQPVLLAGKEVGEEVREEEGEDAGVDFTSITGIDADADGCIYAVDGRRHDGGYRYRVQRVTPAGIVTTVVPEVPPGSWELPRILPSGVFAMRGDDGIGFFDLRLQPVHGVAFAAAPAPPPAPPHTTAAGDLAAPLGRQPDGTEDVTLLVAGRSFPAHRSVLHQSEYFRQRLASASAPASAGGSSNSASGSSSPPQQQQMLQITLDDVDPEVFALLLRHMYCMDIPDHMLIPFAELACRLLLWELCGALEPRVRARVAAELTLETAVEKLLWAEARREWFPQLFNDTKGWYKAHKTEILEKAYESVERLARENLKLMLELHA